MIDYDQWLEVEEEIKQLHQLVKTQREHIDQLAEMLSSIDQDKMINQSTSSHPLEIASEEKPNSLPECSVDNSQSNEIPNTDHVEEYLSISPPVPTESKQLECPFCNAKFANNEDIAYIEHLTNCFNNVNDNF
jgi:hypothetical protein